MSLGPGLVLIWVGYVAVPAWLQIDGPRWFEPPWLLAQLLLAGGIAWGVDALRRRLQQPVLADDGKRRSSIARPVKQDKQRPARPAQEQKQADSPTELLQRARSKRRRRDDPEQDIIMLELD